ncbi:MAG: rod shape-determining protein MreD [Clostridia bacterium]|nr:rod shape-determining protein MreD [Clostridia bacterium]MBQ9846815.1 rod shape-determining protein MreD [Clostridia bacterium]MBQ9958613.1 rod shape-determining protein MreD [Clostridia bacterium]
MRGGNYRRYVYHTVLFLICILLYLWQNSINAFPEIAGLRAIPVIPFVICVTMFNPETAGFVYGFAAGMLMDISWSKISGFNTTILFVLCIICGLLIQFLLNRTPATALLLSGMGCFLYFFVYWLCFHQLAGVADSAYSLMLRYMPMAIYSWAFTLPFYIFVGYMTKKLKND